jgi:hypothetical protein
LIESVAKREPTPLERFLAGVQIPDDTRPQHDGALRKLRDSLAGTPVLGGPR